MKIRALIRMAGTEIPRKAPSPVATPLPPLNRKKTEKQCPAMAAKAAVPITAGLLWLSREAIATDAQPFPASRISVAAPATYPADRRTLVAPVFPLPVKRISLPRLQRYIKNPKGIEPSKYPLRSEE